VKVLLVFNNNVILARTAGGGEAVLIGRGLGYQAKPGQKIDVAKATRVFVPDGERDGNSLAAMVAEIPPEHLLLADEALKIARPGKASPPSSTVVALADHLSFAIKRLEQGIDVEYPLRAEVAHLYPDEFRAAQHAVNFINERLDRPLPQVEAVPIALHLVNAGFATGNLSYTYQMTGIFAQLFEVLEQAYGQTLDRETLSVARFVTHLRYFFVRAQTGHARTKDAGRLGTAIREEYPDAFAIANKLKTVIELRMGQPLSGDEVAYLTLHVARMLADVPAI
jgi:beta-glucoside operon transcriptional antiterminator